MDIEIMTLEKAQQLGVVTVEDDSSAGQEGEELVANQDGSSLGK